jgi:two-component system sensor kinase FixL
MPKQNSPSIHWNEPVLHNLPTLRLGWRDFLLLLAGYVALDWASYIHPLHGLNITPWSPAPALGLVFLLRFDARVVLPMAVAIVLAETMVRGLPVALPMTFVAAGLITSCYWLIARTLQRLLPGDSILADRRSLLLWSVVVLGGTLLNSGLFVVAMSISGYVPGHDVATAIFQYWVGDATGILVTMPLLLMLFADHGRRELRAIATQPAAAALFALVALALWIAFGLGAEADFKYFYVLFLPIAWAAARNGLTGAVVAAAAIQLGIIGAVQWQGIATVTVVEIQLLAAAITLFGYFVGVVVDETRRVSSELKQTLRLAAAGEMAGAMAHELNQPLTALAAYGSACEHLLERNETGTSLRDAVRGMVQESARAAEVMRRLRDFFRTGTTRLEHIGLGELIAGTVGSFSARARQAAIDFQVGDMPDCRMLCDRLQIEVVLRNLLSNAADAVVAQVSGARWVRLTAERDGPSSVCISVTDSGEGLGEANVARLFAGFQSTKSSGLGLGLVISRAIAEAHGGNLWAEVGDHGIFRLLLPIEVGSDHAS